ncbi:MAG: 50S ribosomal protein L21 [Cytophagales bacterium]|nr:50S ribosomal protein L21 [Cytophagales bacterium]MDW8383838.1 50S ribosomal protein L21 [Flammeovirgaceae bacterium]
MYVIVEIAGQQFKVSNDQKIYTQRLNAAEGDIVTFDRVLLADNNGVISVGTPTILGAKVSAKVLAHVKGEKIIVFKKKRRKDYVRKKGHRQLYTQIQITDISLN